MTAAPRRFVAFVRRFLGFLYSPLIAAVRHEVREAAGHARFPMEPAANPLLVGARRYFSQNDEDGILLAILRRLDVAEPRCFLELGVGDGTENNTIILLALGWRGAWIGGEKLAFEPAAEGSRLAFVQSWISGSNAVPLAKGALARIGLSLADVRVASFDLDGNDSHVARALIEAGLRADLFIVEYNAKFPPDIAFEMPHDPLHRWKGDDDYFGASLLSWRDLFSQAGFRLVACNHTGANAFFVSNAHAGRFADVSENLESLYRAGTYNAFPMTGHRTSPKTVRQLAGGR